MDATEVSVLESVESLLKYATDTDHYCEEADCFLETPKCREMHTKAALAELRSALEPTHDSLQPSRLSHDPERIYLEQWKKQNERHAASSLGYTLIEWILTQDGELFPSRVTNRDATVAASVIQWLGTSCGRWFIEQCELKITEARAERRTWHNIECRNIEPDPAHVETARLLVSQYLMTGTERHQTAVLQVAAALQDAANGAVRSTVRSAIDAAYEAGILR